MRRTMTPGRVGSAMSISPAKRSRTTIGEFRFFVS
jgi:hypothetical protein